ncbi:polyphosphate kinase 2 [Tahibacter amnicola]|uniref:ADP/GDP-polyphosphate phosphotransferase n=1 Tax=Tahibacter amnicola TaxID=2976241 RepID=A0ABY6BCC6_9GAMM|nr:polyphosphate kinase 2 [Tahibacter amnicola]UXI67457.1 polyphosphate kinase 2 [Tahibacter amnicola]
MSKLKRKDYEAALESLQHELIEAQRWLMQQGKRLVIVFEGRDAAGKGGVIKAITEQLNTRGYRVVALSKPSEREKSQWYFQRYVAHLPSAGECVLFDRSWYNRAGVEHVMGFCTDTEYQRFLDQCPGFEKLLVDDDILLIKYWLTVDQKFQEERFAERANDKAKRWKISEIDVAARAKYAQYGKARDAMIARTHSPQAPWFLVDFNDQRRGRLNLIRHLLDWLPDRKVPDQYIKLPPLSGNPRKETLPRKALRVKDVY